MSVVTREGLHIYIYMMPAHAACVAAGLLLGCRGLVALSLRVA